MPSPIPDPPTQSFWDASSVLREIVTPKIAPADLARLREMGDLAVRVVAPLAAIADRESPRLVENRIEYHPSYREMEAIAYGSGMVAAKYESKASHLVSFAQGYLFAMAEMGLYCPVCMTDGVARVVSRYGTPEQIARVVPRMGARDASARWTGAMFVTEQTGGSDVGANESVVRNGRLSGFKWFCSNVDANAVLITARPVGASAGTKGLRTYLLTSRDGVAIERLKVKLGVRSMPTGEVRLTDAPVEEVGGFGAMLEMMNMSRLYNAVASVAVIGRAIHEARYYIERRRAFGRPVIEHPLAADTLRDLEDKHLGSMLLTFETIEALDRADRGDEDSARLQRALIPIVKAVTGKLAVPCVSEAMELIGGNAYIEESPLPRLLRDAQVLPIWEGTTNIMVLDALRVARKEGGHEIMLSRIRRHFPDEANAIGAAFAALDERGAREWVWRLAHAFERTLLAETGKTDVVERLLRTGGRYAEPGLLSSS